MAVRQRAVTFLDARERWRERGCGSRGQPCEETRLSLRLDSV